MAGRLNWQRNSYQLRARRSGSVSLADEREWLADDRAARWLNRHQAHRSAKRKAERKAERLRHRAERLRERDIRRKVRAGKLVLWGDSWNDAPASSSISSRQCRRGNVRRPAWGRRYEQRRRHHRT